MRIAFILLLSIQNAFSHGGGEMSANVGPDQGVLEKDNKKGFRLSPESIARFGIQTQPVTTPKSVRLSPSAIIHTRNGPGIYRMRDGFIKQVAFKAMDKKNSTWLVSSSELTLKDKVLVTGIGFVRVVEIGLGEPEEEGAHDEHEGDGEHEEEVEDLRGHDDHGHGKEKSKEHAHD